MTNKCSIRSITHKIHFVKTLPDRKKYAIIDTYQGIIPRDPVNSYVCDIRSAELSSAIRGDIMKKYSVVFAIGGVLYSLMEMIWRGYTHISMALAGGLCLAGIFCIERRFRNMRLLVKCILGALLITAVEFCIGCVVNRRMGLSVWDYSDRPFNILGQICPLFTAVWFLICVPAFFLCRGMNKLIGDSDEED